MANVSEAFGYPFKGKDVFLKYVIWTVMFFVPVLGYYFMMGYHMKALRENCHGKKDNIPDWKTDEALQLLLDGFILFLIDTVYIFIPITIIALSLLPFIIGLIVSAGLVADDTGIKIIGAAGGIIGTIAGIVLLCVGSIWSLIGIISFNVAKVNYVMTGSIFSAFNIFSIGGKIIANLIDFIIYSVLINVMGSIYMGIVLMIAGIPIIGQFILPVIIAPCALYLNLFSTRLLGDIFGNGSLSSGMTSSSSAGTAAGSGLTF